MFTNDLGYIHPHTDKLYFCGRANDVIRTGGESVLAMEVERILDTYEEISECAVFALPDDKFGEAVCAAIVLRRPTPTTNINGSAASASVSHANAMENDYWMKKIRQYCANCQLAGFKRPRRVFCLDSLPRNSSGKVLKHELLKLCTPPVMSKL